MIEIINRGLKDEGVAASSPLFSGEVTIMTERVLMIEDDKALAAMVSEYLGKRGIEVTSKPSAKEGLKLIHQGGFDALVLDVMLPDLDGFEVCRQVRAESDIPILMLTARGDETDRIVGLELGADDYLPKPFNPRELLARLRAILRRRDTGGRSALPACVSDVWRSTETPGWCDSKGRSAC